MLPRPLPPSISDHHATLLESAVGGATRRIDGGEEFSAEIEAALDQSDVVVVA